MAVRSGICRSSIRTYNPSPHGWLSNATRPVSPARYLHLRYGLLKSINLLYDERFAEIIYVFVVIPVSAFAMQSKLAAFGGFGLKDKSSGWYW